MTMPPIPLPPILFYLYYKKYMLKTKNLWLDTPYIHPSNDTSPHTMPRKQDIMTHFLTFISILYLDID